MTDKGATGIEATTAVDVRAGGELHLVRDLLDDQLVDRDHDPMGRVDGIVLTVTDGQQPRVECLESGITVVAVRLHRRLGRWARAAARRWGLRRGRPMRIAWSKVTRVGIETELDLKADDTDALVWEHWLLRHVVGRIPSLKPPNKKNDDDKEKKDKKKEEEEEEEEAK